MPADVVDVDSLDRVSLGCLVAVALPDYHLLSLPFFQKSDIFFSSFGKLMTLEVRIINFEPCFKRWKEYIRLGHLLTPEDSLL